MTRRPRALDSHLNPLATTRRVLRRQPEADHSPSRASTESSCLPVDPALNVRHLHVLRSEPRSAESYRSTPPDSESADANQRTSNSLVTTTYRSLPTKSRKCRSANYSKFWRTKVSASTSVNWSVKFVVVVSARSIRALSNFLLQERTR